MNRRPWRSFAVYLVIVLLFFTLLQYFGESQSAVDQSQADYGTNYTKLMTAVDAQEIEQVSITTYDNYQEVTGINKNGEHFSMPVSKTEGLVSKLMEMGVQVEQKPTPQPSFFANLLGTLLPILLIVGIFLFFMNQSQAGGGKVNQFGKSKAKMQVDMRGKVTFHDVAGVDEVKEELEEVVEFLKTPQKFQAIGAKIPKGVLLFGPPGTGKTLLARAVAGEAGVPFFSISGSDFVEMFVGVGASRVRDLFEQAKKNKPCIIFIDEIDAVGRQRGAGVGGGHDEREQTLNQLLVEMDGFDANEGIIILAATNRPDILDPALLRPGRFDRQVTVPRPDVKGREEILHVHAKGKPLAADVNLKIIAKQTSGFTGADLANLMNEAALLSARENEKTISQSALERSIERVIAGPEKKNGASMNEAELKLVAYHEAGHAVIGHIQEESDPIHKVSIIPRGMAGGYTMSLPEEDRNYMTRSHLLAQVTMLLGGRVAEEIVLGEISTGASNDIERATKLIRQMVTRWGMSDELGTIAFGEDQEQVFLGRDLGHSRNYSEAVAFSIDKEVKAIMDACYAKATKILTDHREDLDRIALALKEKEVLNAFEFAELMKGRELEDIEQDQENIRQAQEEAKARMEKEKKLAQEPPTTPSFTPPPGPGPEATSSTLPSGNQLQDGEGSPLYPPQAVDHGQRSDDLSPQTPSSGLPSDPDRKDT